MGYETNFYGSVSLSSKSIITKINKMIKNEEFPFDFNEISKIKNKILNLNVYGKNYNDYIQKIFLFIALLDNKAYGEVECFGEDRDDMWKIELKDGKVRLLGGYVKYEDEGEYNLDNVKISNEKYDEDDNKQNEGFKKNLYNITKDKKLRNELIVNAI